MSSNEEYKCVRFKGKHGMINLMIPNREPTQDEIEELHRSIAEVIVNNSKQPSTKEKAANE